MQPFHRGKNAYRERLAILADTTNQHKHRTFRAPIPLIEAPAHLVFLTGSDPMADLELRWTPGTTDLSVESRFTRSRGMASPGIVFSYKSPPDGRTGVGVVFGEPPKQADMAAYRQAVQWVESILKWFEPAFEPLACPLMPADPP